MSQTMLLRVSGRLRRPGYTRTTVDGTAWVCVEIEQPGGRGLPVHACHALGQGASAQYVAANAVAHLRTGTRISVRAQRIELGQGSEPHLLLRDVLGIEYPLPPPRHEPAEREEAAS
jgi:hypothetical protein